MTRNRTNRLNLNLQSGSEGWYLKKHAKRFDEAIKENEPTDKIELPPEETPSTMDKRNVYVDPDPGPYSPPNRLLSSFLTGQGQDGHFRRSSTRAGRWALSVDQSPLLRKYNSTIRSGGRGGSVNAVAEEVFTSRM
jgi:hypothetical protein